MPTKARTRSPIPLLYTIGGQEGYEKLLASPALTPTKSGRTETYKGGIIFRHYLCALGHAAAVTVETGKTFKVYGVLAAEDDVAWPGDHSAGSLLHDRLLVRVDEYGKRKK